MPKRFKQQENTMSIYLQVNSSKSLKVVNSNAISTAQIRGIDRNFKIIFLKQA